ncbi:MAG: acyl-CoA dehydrogenase family protein [Acetobacteraceae bacterium]|nr:acyl-CoA dehydrogenase family protein [Acetobacteraceae bacterium]MBV8524802.1 acyl-CoA dehydrogenase family protein [Acetobacteraceae bacterium]
MDFDLTDEQRLLKDSVDRLITERYDFESRNKYRAEPEGWSRALWEQYAELGLLGLPFPESYGGFGGGPVETMIVMEAFGRGLAVEPYFATVVLGGGLIHQAGSEEQKSALLPQIASGEALLAFAHVERQSRYDLANVTTRAHRADGGWRINGEKSIVLHGDVADQLIVSARTSGSPSDRAGIGLFLVDAKDVTRRGYPLQDGLRAAEVKLDDARAEPLSNPEGALSVAEQVVDAAIGALCAEAVGVMQSMHELTLDYLKTRRQFGRPIGDFQALQHRAVDMYVALEQARSMALFATMMAAEEDPAERRRAITAAKAQIGRSGRHIGQEAIQLHGGIGMTMEYKVGHAFKRMTMIDIMFGDAGAHTEELARLGGLFGT